MSILFLKIKYSWTHVIALMFCLTGMSFNLYNDFYVKANEDDNNSDATSSGYKLIIGDIMALAGAFLYALSNIL